MKRISTCKKSTTTTCKKKNQMNIVLEQNVLTFKGKSSKAHKVIESEEEESPDGDSDEDPAEMMAMLSNRLQYLAKKNKKFLSRRNNYKRLQERRSERLLQLQEACTFHC